MVKVVILIQMLKITDVTVLCTVGGVRANICLYYCTFPIYKRIVVAKLTVNGDPNPKQ